MQKSAIFRCMLIAASLTGLTSLTALAAPAGEWPTTGGDQANTKFSALAQINRNNVGSLERAWVYHYATGSESPPAQAVGRNFEVTPLVIDGVMYITTPIASAAVVALDPVSGKEIWKWAAPSVVSGRGLAYWKGPNGPRLVLAADGGLVALDVRTGQLAKDFGEGGKIVVDADLPLTERARLPNPVAIFKDIAIAGAITGEGGVPGPSGDIRAWNLRTGKLAWRFHTIPRPGDPGFDTWPNVESTQRRPGANVWSQFSVDEEQELVFAPIASPGYDWYGGDRLGDNLYGNSLVALDARTGKRRWHFQMVHHDLLDYDVTGAPTLVDIKKGGRTIPAVVQNTKMGMVFIFDRRNGEPIFGVEERPVPQSAMPGERSSPTQPFPLKPPILGRTSMTRAEISKLSPESEKFCTEFFDRAKPGSIYTPLGPELMVSFPGTNGGANWGGASYDPARSLVFVNISNIGTTGSLTKAPPESGLIYRNNGAFQRFVDQDRFPCQIGPWGELAAINVNTGDVAWKVPLGSYREVEAKGFLQHGAANLGGSIVTAGGVLFIAATNDRRFRAFDVETGAELWRTDLEATGNATPSTYLGKDNKQYVVIAAGGPGNWRSVGNTVGDASDSVIAFRLPD